MSKKFIKNIEHKTILEFKKLIDYKQGQIVSMTIAQNDAVSMTLFSFWEGEGVSTHSAPGDALVYILDGEAEVTVDEEKFTVKQNECIVMPANIPHGLEAIKNFKMLLIVVNR